MPQLDGALAYLGTVGSEACDVKALEVCVARFRQLAVR